MADLTPLQEWGLAVAVVSGIGGLTLGIMNALNYYRDNRPRLKVRFNVRHVVVRMNGPGGRVEDGVGVITVTNVGRLTVVPELVGIDRREGLQLIMMTPAPLGRGNLLEELEPGHAIALRFDATTMIEDARNLTFDRAWVRTQADEMFHGTREEMGTFTKELLALDERIRAGNSTTPDATPPR